MKFVRSKVLILLLVSLLLVSCAAPVTETMAAEVETAVQSDMATMETSVSTETQTAVQTPAETMVSTEDSTSSSEGSEVEIEDFAFVPAVVTVKAGTTVTWTNKDKVQHTVTSDTGLFDSGLFGKGESFSFTFTEAGTFAYHCTPHPNMKATIIVE